MDLFILTGFCSCISILWRLWPKLINRMRISVNIHQSKIDVVKFDGMNNFGKWRSEVTNVLIASNLQDSLLYDKELEEISEKDWNKMNRMYSVIRSC